MKTKFYLYIGMLMVALLAGCDRFEEDLIEEVIAGEGLYRIEVGIANDDATRVNLDGVSLTWKKGDVIMIAEVMENSRLTEARTFAIEAERDVNEDGKYAVFTLLDGKPLVMGKMYVAVHGIAKEMIATSINNKGMIEYQQSNLLNYPNADKEVINNQYLLFSNQIVITNDNQAKFKFAHLNSVIEYRIKLADSIKEKYHITDIEISADDNCCFFTTVSLDANGIEADKSMLNFSSSAELIYKPIISNDDYYTVRSLVAFDQTLKEVKGNFTFKISIDGGYCAVISKPAKLLKTGAVYKTELIIDEVLELKEVHRQVLIDFYNEMDGDNWNDNTNWCSDKPLGEWQGVRYNDEKGVVGLSLQSNNLTGTIPSSFYKLTSLTYIYLGDNKISGIIPQDINRLSALQVLSIGANKLYGEIPKSLGSIESLYYLVLYGNNFTGSIPKELANLKKLYFLGLSNNSLSGTIPKELSELSDLDGLNLSSNNLTGEIPVELANLSNLRALVLNSNMLTGGIPKELGQLKILRGLILSSNLLSGEIPKELGQLKNLTDFYLSYNNLEGTIPEEFANVLAMPGVSYDITKNRLVGILPASMNNSEHLKVHWRFLLFQQTGYGFDKSSLAPIGTEMTDLITLDGQKINTHNVYAKNKLTIIHYWATWCPYSRAVLSMIKDAYSKYCNKGLEIISINDVEDESLVRHYISDNGMTWINVTNRIPYIDMGWVPQIYVVNERGELVFSDYLLNQREDLPIFLELILGNTN